MKHEISFLQYSLLIIKTLLIESFQMFKYFRCKYIFLLPSIINYSITVKSLATYKYLNSKHYQTH